jgi:hypothetical protein
VGFELTIPVFERGKTDHALDRAATAFGCSFSDFKQFENFVSILFVQKLASLFLFKTHFDQVTARNSLLELKGYELSETKGTGAVMNTD